MLGDCAPDPFRARNPLALAQPVQRLELGRRKVYDGPHGVIISRYQMMRNCHGTLMAGRTVQFQIDFVDLHIRLRGQPAAVGFEPGFGCGAGFGIGLPSGTGAGLLGGA